MAGASMKSIKLRIHSMQNTRQITKAMEMVAASKMNKAQEKALRTRPYYTTLHSTLSGIAAATRDFSSPYLQKREEKRVCCVAIAGDRGLVAVLYAAVGLLAAGDVPAAVAAGAGDGVADRVLVAPLVDDALAAVVDDRASGRLDEPERRGEGRETAVGVGSHDRHEIECFQKIEYLRLRKRRAGFERNLMVRLSDGTR